MKMVEKETKKAIWYEFGVMSNKFKLKSDDENIAHLCMSLHFASTAPIAIYSPVSGVIDPKKMLDDNIINMDNEQFKIAVRACMKTIKEVKLK